MTQKVIIDPLTRLSGLLRIEVTIEDNKVTNAKCTGNMFRGLENILRGRSPLEIVYYTERICGVCSTAHSYISSLAVENALGITGDLNSSVIRDFIHGCEFLQNHIRHFYAFVLPDYIKGPPISPMYNEELVDYRVPDYINQRLSGHYLEGLKYSSMARQILAILCGKAPHNHGIQIGSTTANFDASQYVEINSMLKNITDFIKEVMLEDIDIISMYYGDYYEKGITDGSYLSYGAFDVYTNTEAFYLKPAVMINGIKYNMDENKIHEDIYYCNDSDGNRLIKAVRYDGLAMEVGPLARMQLTGEYTRGSSTMDRLKARVLECYKIAGIMQKLLFMMEFSSSSKVEYEIPESGCGKALKDTTRGALGHWVYIENKRIRGYEIMTPSSWNLSPQDSTGEKGVLEKALIGTNIENEQFPVEIGRIIRSFDPCISCAIHVTTSKESWELQII